MSELNLPSNAKPEIAVRAKRADVQMFLGGETTVIASLLKIDNIKIIGENEADPEGCIGNFITDDLQTYIKVVGLIDIKLEVKLSIS
jgi:valyl-tRNA synthetase